MKTAVSIPDPLFEKAERQARKRGISRSKLYAEALRTLLENDEAERSQLTAELDEVYGAADSGLDPAWKAYQARHIARRSEW